MGSLCLYILSLLSPDVTPSQLLSPFLLFFSYHLCLKSSELASDFIPHPLEPSCIPKKVVFLTDIQLYLFLSQNHDLAYLDLLRTGPNSGIPTARLLRVSAYSKQRDQWIWLVLLPRGLYISVCVLLLVFFIQEAVHRKDAFSPFLIPYN